MAKRKRDEFANKATVDLTMSAADTLTFQQIRFAVGLFQGVALNLHRVDWAVTQATYALMVAAADTFTVALTTSNQTPDINDATDPSVIARMMLYNANVSVDRFSDPVTMDFSGLPSGGIIIAANPLFAAMNSGSLGTAGRARITMWFTFIELSDRDYLELIEGRISSNI